MKCVSDWVTSQETELLCAFNNLCNRPWVCWNVTMWCFADLYRWWDEIAPGRGKKVGSSVVTVLIYPWNFEFWCFLNCNLVLTCFVSKRHMNFYLFLVFESLYSVWFVGFLFYAVYVSVSLHVWGFIWKDTINVMCMFFTIMEFNCCSI